jgi:hypothetical protein
VSACAPQGDFPFVYLTRPIQVCASRPVPRRSLASHHRAAIRRAPARRVAGAARAKFFISGVIIIIFNFCVILAAPYVTIAGQGTSKVVVSAHVSDASHPIVNAAGALQVGAAAAVGGVFALNAVAVTFILPLVIASFELFCLPCPLLAFMRT